MNRMPIRAINLATACHEKEREAQLEAQRLETTPRIANLTDKSYTLHGFRVIDRLGRSIGQIDWIWVNDTKEYEEYVSVHLRWLRGTARAIPAEGAYVDTEALTVRLPYTKEQFRRAPRFSIDRELTTHQRLGIRAHFGPHRSLVRNMAQAEALAA